MSSNDVSNATYIPSLNSDYDISELNPNRQYIGSQNRLNTFHDYKDFDRYRLKDENLYKSDRNYKTVYNTIELDEYTKIALENKGLFGWWESKSVSPCPAKITFSQPQRKLTETLNFCKENFKEGYQPDFITTDENKRLLLESQRQLNTYCKCPKKNNCSCYNNTSLQPSDFVNVVKQLQKAITLAEILFRMVSHNALELTASVKDVKRVLIRSRLSWFLFGLKPPDKSDLDKLNIYPLQQTIAEKLLNKLSDSTRKPIDAESLYNKLNYNVYQDRFDAGDLVYKALMFANNLYDNSNRLTSLFKKSPIKLKSCRLSVKPIVTKHTSNATDNTVTSINISNNSSSIKDTGSHVINETLDPAGQATDNPMNVYSNSLLGTDDIKPIIRHDSNRNKAQIAIDKRILKHLCRERSKDIENIKEDWDHLLNENIIDEPFANKDRRLEVMAEIRKKFHENSSSTETIATVNNENENENEQNKANHSRDLFVNNVNVFTKPFIKFYRSMFGSNDEQLWIPDDCYPDSASLVKIKEILSSIKQKNLEIQRRNVGMSTPVRYRFSDFSEIVLKHISSEIIGPEVRELLNASDKPRTSEKSVLTKEHFNKMNITPEYNYLGYNIGKYQGGMDDLTEHQQPNPMIMVAEPPGGCTAQLLEPLKYKFAQRYADFENVLKSAPHNITYNGPDTEQINVNKHLLTFPHNDIVQKQQLLQKELEFCEQLRNDTVRDPPLRDTRPVDVIYETKEYDRRSANCYANCQFKPNNKCTTAKIYQDNIVVDRQNVCFDPTVKIIDKVLNKNRLPGRVVRPINMFEPSKQTETYKDGECPPDFDYIQKYFGAEFVRSNFD